MMGVVSDGLLTGSAHVWFLGTNEVYRHARDLIMYGPLFIERWLTVFHELHNIVAKDNTQAIILLGRWGFEVGVGDDVEHRGVQFAKFKIQRERSGQKDSNLRPVASEATALT